MTTLRVEAQVSSDELIKAVDRLSPPDLESFVFQVIALRARRRAPSLSRAEGELLLKINQGMPSDLQVRYAELMAKRRAESLDSTEHDELLRLTDQVEEWEAQRMQCLAELARIRNTTLSDLMTTLGIPAPEYV